MDNFWLASSPSNPRRARSGRQQSKWIWLAPLVVLAFLAGLYLIWPGFERFINDAYRVLSSGEQDEVERWVRGFGAWGFAVILTLMLLQTIVPFLPSLVTMVVAVLAYGPALGGIMAWGGLLAAACLGYGIGVCFGPLITESLIGSKTEQKVERFVERYGLWGVVAARVSPALSTDAVSVVAGLVRMNFFRFLLATAAGTLPLAILVGWLGTDIERMETGLVVVSILSIVTFIGYVVYDRRKRPG